MGLREKERERKMEKKKTKYVINIISSITVSLSLSLSWILFQICSFVYVLLFWFWCVWLPVYCQSPDLVPWNKTVNNPWKPGMKQWHPWNKTVNNPWKPGMKEWQPWNKFRQLTTLESLEWKSNNPNLKEQISSKVKWFDNLESLEKVR